MAPYARAAGVVGAALAGCRDGGPEARMAVRRVGDAAEAEPEAEAEGVSAVAPGVRLGAQRGEPLGCRRRGGGERGEQRGEAGAERGGVARGGRRRGAADQRSKAAASSSLVGAAGTGAARRDEEEEEEEEEHDEWYRCRGERHGWVPGREAS